MRGGTVTHRYAQHDVTSNSSLSHTQMCLQEINEILVDISKELLSFRDMGERLVKALRCKHAY